MQRKISTDGFTKLLYENWIDGYKYYGRYVNERTINYVSKYMTKKDEDNPDYISIVLCSKGARV